MPSPSPMTVRYTWGTGHLSVLAEPQLPAAGGRYRVVLWPLQPDRALLTKKLSLLVTKMSTWEEHICHGASRYGRWAFSSWVQYTTDTMHNLLGWPSVSLKRSAAFRIWRKVVRMDRENTFGIKEITYPTSNNRTPLKAMPIIANVMWSIILVKYSVIMDTAVGAKSGRKRKLY